MTKRSAKRFLREGHLDEAAFQPDTKVRRLNVHTGGGWSPMGQAANEDRDQSYVKTIKPKSEGQSALLSAIDEKNLVLALGPAGTGKTYLAIAKAVEALEAGKVGRIVLSRPAVEAGESIGFLPGDMEDKLAPYLRPLYDALTDRLSMKRVKALMAEGLIEIAPVGYMRGPHAQQRLRRHRRSAELHLCAAQDAFDASRLEFDHDRHRRPGAVGSPARRLRPGRCRRTVRKR